MAVCRGLRSLSAFQLLLLLFCCCGVFVVFVVVVDDDADDDDKLKMILAVMLVLGHYGLGLRGLSLAKNSRPKSWQTTKFTINFHRLEHSDWSKLYFKIHIPYLLTVGNRGLVRVLEKQDFITFYRNPLHYGMSLALNVLALLTLLDNGHSYICI